MKMGHPTRHSHKLTRLTGRLLGSLLFAALVAGLTGCSKQELYTELSERQANEMVALLLDTGIDAVKQAKDGHFAILTPAGNFGRAVRTLSTQGYPRDAFDTIGEVFKREGFISSPLEERARLLHAMSQEMSNTLAHIDGVVTARVHLVVPERNPLSDQPLPASASVFIKHRADRLLADQVPQIKALVVNSIEGLTYENVTVALFSAEPLTKRPRALVAPAQAGMLNNQVLAGGGLGLIASLSGGLLWLRAGRQKRSEQQPDGTRQLMAADRST